MKAESTLRAAKKLVRLGDIDQAIVVCETFLRKFPKNARIRQQVETIKTQHFSSAALPAAQKDQLNHAFKAGAYDTLIPRVIQLLQHIPQSYFLWNLLGNAQLKMNAPHKAEQAFAKAIKLDPKTANAYVGLGDVHKFNQNYTGAIACYLQALERQPDNLTALNNLGNQLSAAGQLENAIEVFSKAHDISPQNCLILFNLSGVYATLNRLDQAEETLQKTIALAPEFSEAHYNLGLVQSLQGKRDKAVKSYEAALTLDPGHESARTEKLHQLAHMCDWAGLSEFAQLPAEFGAKGPPPFAFLAVQDEPMQQLRRAQVYAKRFGAPQLPPPFQGTRKGGQRLKVGYFSADFHNHATMYLMGGLFEHHDREKFEIIAYSFGPTAHDAARNRLCTHIDTFREVGHLTPSEIAKCGQQDALDIAIDLKGYTGDSRPEIFIHRPAPIQISWLGYPGSMGSDAYDYCIADPTVLPIAQRASYSESIIFMPGSYQANDRNRQISSRPFSKKECGLPDHGFVFCCFNNSYKITPAEFDIWMRLLNALGGSVLWLLGSNTWAEANLQRAAKARGVCPSRLIFAERMEVADHLARQKLADLFLDTFVCNAHTTASDALWAGLPIITKAGDQFAARVCASLLQAVGLPELITDSAEAYETQALYLAQHPAELAALRRRLEQNRDTCTLFDTQAFTHNIESAFSKAQQIRENGQIPHDFHAGPPNN